ncbi:unnamed protein product [marine sediment metagenome]|uniref:NAD-dependent epimerase/dehydratase domain-containing protein n=1 Tax=marine sediment metagenome TaxID=412755 RepID=X1DXB0_9ZZZZ
MRILITGSRGFIGAHLVEALKKRKHEVTELDLELGNDITKEIKGNYDIIYHLAAYSLIKTRDNPRKAIDVNIKGTLNVLELARKCNAKVIFSSASSVYGIPFYDVVKETDPIQPVSIYGTTKASAEILIETYNKLYSVDYLIFRFTNVYGPEQKTGVIPSFIDSIGNNAPVVIFGSGNQTRDFVYVGDVVHFLLRVKEPNKKNMTLNLGSGIATSIIELAVMCTEIMGKQNEIINRPVERDERWGFSADMTRFNEVFNEVPKSSLKEGLKKTCLEERSE